ncbi:MAG: CapA family protein [Chloroflexota bacterium]
MVNENPCTSKADAFVLEPEPKPWSSHVSEEEIPRSLDMLTSGTLTTRLLALGGQSFDVLAVGDIMLAGRTRSYIRKHGDEYPFAAVLPLLHRASIVLGNLEGPLAKHAHRSDRTFSYRVPPRLAQTLIHAGVDVVTLANNHLLDCGHAGVIETIDALEEAGVAFVGGGRNERLAHEPVIMQAGQYSVGLLGYYWNRRCAARADLPGSATDTPAELAADIRNLRPRVDRVVVTFHWGIPYEREPSRDDRAKARLAVDCGADAVIGHHVHVMQPFEVYRGCPIFYGIGNFAFGSGNSRAEGLILGLRFFEARTEAHVYPLYVKNRDPRVAYQPKVLTAKSGQRMLDQLRRLSNESGALMRDEDGWGRLELPGHDASGTGLNSLDC